jgi:hypothetical protein
MPNKMSTEAADKDKPSFHGIFTDPWLKCLNWKQPFQDQLSLDLLSQFVSFAEGPWRPVWSPYPLLQGKVTSLQPRGPRRRN